MIRTICSRTSSDYKRLTKHENEDAQWIIARSENVCDKPLFANGVIMVNGMLRFLVNEA